MKRILRDVSWASLGQVANFGLAVGLIKVWAVYLTPAELGLMALIISVPSILVGILVDPLVRAVLVRYSAHCENGKQNEFRTVSWGIIAKVCKVATSAIILIGVPVTYYVGLHWSTPLLVAGLFVVDTRRYFEQTLFAAARQQKLIAIFSFGDVGLRFIFLWLFLHFFGSSAYLAVAGNFLGGMILLIVLILKIRKLNPIIDRFIDVVYHKDVHKELIKLARPILPSNILANISENSVRYIVAATLGLHQAGLFVAIYGLVKRPFGMLSDIGFSTMLPAYSEAVAKNNTDKARYIRWAWFIGIVFFSLIGVGVFYTSSELIVKILLSNKFEAAGEYLYIVGIVMLACNINAIYTGILLTHGDGRSVLWGNIISAVLILVLLFTLIPRYELQGAIYAIGFGYLVQLVFLISISRHLIVSLLGENGAQIRR